MLPPITRPVRIMLLRGKAIALFAFVTDLIRGFAIRVPGRRREHLGRIFILEMPAPVCFICRSSRLLFCGCFVCGLMHLVSFAAFGTFVPCFLRCFFISLVFQISRVQFRLSRCSFFAFVSSIPYFVQLVFNTQLRRAAFELLWK